MYTRRRIAVFAVGIVRGTDHGNGLLGKSGCVFSTIPLLSFMFCLTFLSQATSSNHLDGVKKLRAFKCSKHNDVPMGQAASVS
jgi:hypothetical protein